MDNGKRVQVHIPYHGLLQRARELAALGINPEVFMDAEAVAGAERADLEMIRDLFGSNGLRITVHGPYAGLNPGSADELRRLATEEAYMRAIEAAGQMGPKNMVLHAGYDEKRFHRDVDLWMYQSMKTWPGVVKEAERLGITLVAENIFEKRPDTLKRLIDEVASPNLRACIDSGHLNLFSDAPTGEWFSTLGERVGEVHVHDNFGRIDDHLPVGEGSIDFEDFFRHQRAHSPGAVITIEPHGEDGIRRGLEAIRRFV